MPRKKPAAAVAAFAPDTTVYCGKCHAHVEARELDNGKTCPFCGSADIKPF